MDINSIAILIGVLIVLVILLSPVTYNIITNLLKWTRISWLDRSTDEEKVQIIQEVHNAIDALADNEKGATIVIDVRGEAHEYVTDSERIDSLVSANLIINIFEGSKTPLHDGAIIIKNNRIQRVSAYITKLSEQEVPSKFGTRHRSALGLAEVTKAIIIVLSEETGTVRVFHNSKWEDVESKDLFNTIIQHWGHKEK